MLKLFLKKCHVLLLSISLMSDVVLLSLSHVQNLGRDISLTSNMVSTASPVRPTRVCSPVNHYVFLLFSFYE